MAYNQKQDYDGKSIKELMIIRDKFKVAADAPRAPKMFNEHLQWVTMKIAERIGKNCDKIRT